MEGLVVLYAKLTLRVNPTKSAVAPAWERSILGYSFWVAPGKIVQRRVSPKALEAMKERVREITSRSSGRSLLQVVARLRSYLVGWKAYFRVADTPGVLSGMDQWLHRRLRMLMLKQWKRGRTMYSDALSVVPNMPIGRHRIVAHFRSEPDHPPRHRARPRCKVLP